MAGTFAGFEPYRLNGVQVTEEEFGRGSYAAVLRLEYRGLKCAGKKLHRVLHEEERDIVYRFEGECRLLSQIKHPNIVQFIGVYFEEGSEIPILIMEFLPTTLTRCIDTYGVLPEEISYSILHDVALGLCHLHCQTPPIVHRDLSANNILLASNMKAKISDLGVARILNLVPFQMTRMTRAPGTIAYMPPEALSEEPRYDTRIDEFSYGVLMIHILSGRWPMPCEATRFNPENGRLIPLSEAERRDQYIQDIGNEHPLMDLILSCVSNDPEQRARAVEIVQQMEPMTRQFPPAFLNRVEMLQQIRADATEKQSLREENERIATQAEQAREEVERVTQQYQTDMDDLNAAIRTERRRRRRLASSLEISRQEAETAEQEHQTQIRQLRTEMSQVNTRREAAERRRQRLTTELEQSRREAQQHLDQVEELRTELTQVSSRNTTIRAALRTQLQRRRSLAAQLDQIRQEVEAAVQQHQALIQELHTEMAHVNTRREAAERRRQRLTTELEQSRREAQQHLDQVEELRTELTQVSDQNTAIRAALQTQRQRRWSLAAQLDQIRQEAEAEVQQHHAQIQELRTEMTQIRDQNAATQVQLQEENQRLAAELEQGRQEVEMAARQHQSQVQELQTELTRVNDRNVTMEVQLRECHRLEQLAQHHQEEIERSELAHSIEMEQTRLRLAELQTANEALQTQMRATIETHQAEVRAQNETHQAAVSEAREEERMTLRNRQDTLEAEIARLRSENEALQATVASKDEELNVKSQIVASKRSETLAMQEALNTKNVTLDLKEFELASKNTILERQSTTIGGLNEQLLRAREFLSGQKPQPHALHPQAKITWEPCSHVPVGMSDAQTVVIRGRVYFGGGGGAVDDCQVFCYNPSQDTWNTLPACPVRYFGLGLLGEKLITVGGEKKSDNEITNEVYEFDDVTQSWKQSIRPMPIARHSPAVISHHSSLIVAGGYALHGMTKTVEVFKEESSQWYTTESLPYYWYDASSVVINDRWYLLGGTADGDEYSNRSVCADIDILLQKVLPCDQASADRGNITNSAWKILPNTPYYGPAAATLGTSLLAMGGTATFEGALNPQTAVYIYSPCTNEWIHISDLPTPRVEAAIAMLSPTELLVISGEDSSVTTVFKGCLQIQK